MIVGVGLGLFAALHRLPDMAQLGHEGEMIRARVIQPADLRDREVVRMEHMVERPAENRIARVERGIEAASAPRIETA